MQMDSTDSDYQSSDEEVVEYLWLNITVILLINFVFLLYQLQEEFTKGRLQPGLIVRKTPQKQFANDFVS